jgi:surfactin synthase thioesterase subunit
MDRMAQFETWFHAPEDYSARSGRSVTLFCFPFAGAGPSAYHAFCKALPRHIMPFVARLPGRPSARRELAGAGIVAIAAQLSTAILPVLSERPAIFWGHSMGSLVAFELARALGARMAPQLLIVSGHRAPHLPRRGRQIAMEKLGDAEVIEVLREYGGTPTAVLESPELLSVFLPLVRADLLALDNYRYLEGQKLDCDILCLNGASDRQINRECADAWREQTTGSFDCELLPGGHFFLSESRVAAVRRISEAIYHVIGKAQPLRMKAGE